MRTATKEHPQTDRISGLKQEPRTLLRLGAAAALAFLFAGLRVSNLFSPFAAALMAACPFDGLIGVF